MQNYGHRFGRKQGSAERFTFKDEKALVLYFVIEST
jgi:hypothetical protein